MGVVLGGGDGDLVSLGIEHSHLEVGRRHIEWLVQERIVPFRIGRNLAELPILTGEADIIKSHRESSGWQPVIEHQKSSECTRGWEMSDCQVHGLQWLCPLIMSDCFSSLPTLVEGCHAEVDTMSPGTDS